MRSKLLTDARVTLQMLQQLKQNPTCSATQVCFLQTTICSRDTLTSTARNDVSILGAAQTTDLVGKTDTGTKADTANDEHGQVLSEGTQDGANTEGGTTQNHDQLPATNLGNGRCEEAEKSTCNRARCEQQFLRVLKDCWTMWLSSSARSTTKQGSARSLTGQEED